VTGTTRERQLQRLLAVAFLIGAVVVGAMPRLADHGPRSTPLFPTDSVALSYLAAAALLWRPQRLAARLGLWGGALATVVLVVHGSQPWEGPTLAILPGELGLGIHVADLFVAVAVGFVAWALDRHVLVGEAAANSISDR
jgi:hypothetical protein